MSIVSDSYVSFQNTDKKKKTSSQKFEDAEKGTQSVYEEALKEDKKKSGLNNWVNSMGNSKVQNKVNKRRAQFNMYANDLDNKVKQMVVNSFDCEADYVLQQEIATLYAKEGKASIKTKDLVGLLEKQGYKVSRESIKATYRSDFKGSHNGEIREGHHVTVLTVTDPETGAEIKIADSNGNAEIEIEEVLGDIMISIPRVKEQAIEYGHSFERELAYMVVHGFYHIMGYDHIQDDDKIIMREKEENVLNNLNINRE